MKDFKHQQDDDIDLSTGDIIMVDATQQHQRDIIMTRPGSLKSDPGRGVGIEDYFNDENQEYLLRKIRQEMIRDGIKVTQIKETDGNITLTGKYENY